MECRGLGGHAFRGAARVGTRAPRTRALLAPMNDQGFRMLWLQRSCLHVPVAQCVQLIRAQVQYPGPGCLRGEASVTILATEFHELVVQVFHGAYSLVG